MYVGFHVECLKSEREKKENEFQLFLFLSESSCKECIDKVQSLSLKAQEGYNGSHSSRSASEAQEPCKACTG